jgi:phosphoribosyl-dephospho-CoA transferase
MFSRHELAWLSSAGWDAAIDRAQPGERAAFEQWRRMDWPAIVRRADAGLEPGHVSLGIPLPPAADGSKGRIALRALKALVARRSPPLALADAARSAPTLWEASLAALAMDSFASGTALHAYGSLAMQAITKLPYVTSTSDIDLLFAPANIESLRKGLALLEQYASLLPLDGEIVFPSGAAVAWKEWLAAESVHARVLVKEANAVRLASIAELLASLEAA